MPRDRIPVVSWQGLIFLVVLLIVAILLYNLSPVLTRRRLSRWATSSGFRLVSFSTVPFYDGPRAWQRNRYKCDYRIVVETQSGVRREGWLLEDWPFLDLGRPTYEVQWDEVS
jgi:hypothetical protein